MDEKVKLALEKSKDVNTLAEMKAIFNQQGIELTDQNLSLIFDKLTDYKNGKLSDEELEQVDGGSIWDYLYDKILKPIVGGIAG